MKLLLFLFALIGSLSSTAQHQLQKIWETDTTLASPGIRVDNKKTSNKFFGKRMTIRLERNYRSR